MADVISDKPSRLNCYGENSFTFLLFQALHGHDLLTEVLLRNLRPFGRGGAPFPVAQLDAAEPEVWLFPNFGKRHGFGEPDALILVGRHSFWVEAENLVDVAAAGSAVRRAVVQLLRFHFFKDALRRVKTRQTGVWHRAIQGPTVSNDGVAKLGVLRVAEHKALRKIRRRLTATEPHYVLLSYRMPRGLGGNSRLEIALGELLSEVQEQVSKSLRAWADEVGFPAASLPPMPSPNRFWYAYWQGHLRDKFRVHQAEDPLVNLVG